MQRVNITTVTDTGDGKSGGFAKVTAEVMVAGLVVLALGGWAGRWVTVGRPRGDQGIASGLGVDGSLRVEKGRLRQSAG